MILKPEDIVIEYYPVVGTNNNWVDRQPTCVKVTHVPSGVVVKQENARSVYRNKHNALILLEMILEGLR
jgi:protein subunit release factor A